MPYLHKSITLIILLLLISCEEEADDPADEVDEDRVEIRPTVIFDIADDEPLHFHVETQGTVEPANEITLQTRISGYVDHHQIREGRQVQRGETLIALDDQEWQLALEQAREDKEEVVAEFNIERNARMRNQSGDSEGQSDFTQLRRLMGVRSAELAVEQAELELSYATLKAPFEGTIAVEKNFSSGEYLSAGTEVGRLVDNSQVQVRYDLLENELTMVEPGMGVELTTSGGQTVEGEVEAVSPVVDPESKTGKVVARFDNPDGILRSGMTVDGRILTEMVDGRVRAPREAMLERDGRPLVFKLNNDTVEWIYIDPIAETSDWIILDEEEIAPGDTLAVDRHFAISHQQIVEPRIR